MTLILAVAALVFFILAILGIDLHPRFKSLPVALAIWFIIVFFLGGK